MANETPDRTAPYRVLLNDYKAREWTFFVFAEHDALETYCESLKSQELIASFRILPAPEVAANLSALTQILISYGIA